MFRERYSRLKIDGSAGLDTYICRSETKRFHVINVRYDEVEKDAVVYQINWRKLSSLPLNC